MKTILLTAIIVFAAAGAYAFDLGGIFSGCGKPAALKDLAGAAPEAPKPGAVNFPMNIKPEDARYYIETKAPVVIDIRTAEEHAAGHLGATSLVMDYYAPDFKEQLAKLDRNSGYLLYCRSGRRSGDALQTMKDLGFTDIHHIAGGITAWTAAGLPVVK